MEEEIENHHDPKEIESTENVSVTEIIGTLNKGIGKWIETKTEIKKGVEKKIDVPIGIEVTNVKENGQKDQVEVTELKKNQKVGQNHLALAINTKRVKRIKGKRVINLTRKKK